MRLGIQFKLVATLVLAGLLPLLVSLAVLLSGVVQLRARSVGQALRSTARQQADHVATLMSAQIEFTWLLTQLPSTSNVLRVSNSRPPPTHQEIQEIEAKWAQMTPSEDPLARVMDNLLSRRWKAVQARQPRFAEVIITDARGRLVAATNKTSDYYQADEAWWIDCYAEGRGKLFLSDVAWDASAVGVDGTPGALVANLCMPIYADDTGGSDSIGPNGSQVLGVLKASFDATWFVRQLDITAAASGYTQSNLWMIGADGKPLPGSLHLDTVPELSRALVTRITEFRNGWISNTDIPDNGMLAFASVRLPVMAPLSGATGKPLIDQPDVSWFVIVSTDRNAALAPIYRLAWMICGGGLFVILGCFVAGVLIARREVIRPLLALSRGVRELERGNVDYRLPIESNRQRSRDPAEQAQPHHHLFRDDEVGDLARNFNRMADQLRTNLLRLSQTDAMKQRFLDLTGHEMRTPLTYLLGMLHLAERRGAGSIDSDMLQNLTSKAKRLNHIVENMLKLVQQPGFGSDYATLNLSVFSMGPLVGLVTQELLHFLQERAMRWELDVPEDLPRVTADYDKVRDVLMNLFTNAIRFSPDGAPVGLKIFRRGEDEIEIIVSDRGPGMSPDQVSRVISPFSTAEEALMTHSSGGAGGELSFGSRGMGLGLSVARRFIDMHGGSLTLDTSPGTGTRVHVVLPLEAHVLPERVPQM